MCASNTAREFAELMDRAVNVDFLRLSDSKAKAIIPELHKKIRGKARFLSIPHPPAQTPRIQVTPSDFVVALAGLLAN